MNSTYESSQYGGLLFPLLHTQTGSPWIKKDVLKNGRNSRGEKGTGFTKAEVVCLTNSGRFGCIFNSIMG